VGSIYDRQRLTPIQVMTVAERRFADAVALCETGKNAHANGAQYLGGFVIELLLKAQLLRRFTAMQGSAKPLSDADREVWNLIYRSHDLQEMLQRMPDLEAKVEKRGQRDGIPYRSHLRNICMTWTVFARYSTLTTTIADASAWLERIRSLKEVLK
jgi:hypothetical protein